MRRVPSPAALVFDLDGTLVDSRQDLATGINALRGERGLAPLTLSAVQGMVGEGARVLVGRALPEVAPDDLDAALRRFLDLYAGVCTDATVAYPGIPAAIATLARTYPLGLLTNKPERMTRELLDHLGLAAAFRVVVGGDTLATRKPDPEGLRWVADRLGAAVADTLLIGDSSIDARTARAAGARLALVTWGFRPREELEAAAPELLCESAADLVAALLPKAPSS